MSPITKFNSVEELTDHLESICGPNNEKLTAEHYDLYTMKSSLELEYFCDDFGRAVEDATSIDFPVELINKFNEFVQQSDDIRKIAESMIPWMYAKSYHTTSNTAIQHFLSLQKHILPEPTNEVKLGLLRTFQQSLKGATLPESLTSELEGEIDTYTKWIVAKVLEEPVPAAPDYLAGQDGRKRLEDEKAKNAKLETELNELKATGGESSKKELEDEKAISAKLRKELEDEKATIIKLREELEDGKLGRERELEDEKAISVKLRKELEDEKAMNVELKKRVQAALSNVKAALARVMERQLLLANHRTCNQNLRRSFMQPPPTFPHIFLLLFPVLFQVSSSHLLVAS